MTTIMSIITNTTIIITNKLIHKAAASSVAKDTYREAAAVYFLFKHEPVEIATGRISDCH